jgi:hypothetical protein
MAHLPLIIIDGPTIPMGQSLSDGVDCSEGEIVRITVPQEFTNSNLTFQVSSDGNMYNDLVDDDGDEVTVVAKQDTTIFIEGRWVTAVAFIKIRSGTRASPVEQRYDHCKFAIALQQSASRSSSEPPSRK